jgi:hypothetical protein
MKPFTVACIPLRHNTQNTFSSPAVGASVVGATTGAAVGTLGHPQRLPISAKA